MPLQPIDPTDPAIGLVADGTTVNALATWQKTLDAGVAAGADAVIQFPAGTTIIAVPSSNFAEEYAQPASLSRLTIQGRGIGQTIVRVCATTPDAALTYGTLSDFLRIPPSGGELIIAGASFFGPGKVDPPAMPHYPGDPTAANFNGDFIKGTLNWLQLRGATAPVTVTIRDVELAGFINGIGFDDTPAVDVLVQIFDSRLACYGCPAGMGSAPGDRRKLHAYRTRFGPASIPAADNFGKFWNHFLYIAPGAATHLEDCDFGSPPEVPVGDPDYAGGEGNAQFYSANALTTRPPYCELINCRAYPSMGGFFLLPAGAHVLGGYYGNKAGLLVGGDDIIIEDAKLDCPVSNGFQGGPEIDIVGCQLLPQFNLNIVAGDASLTSCVARRGAKVGTPCTAAVTPSGGRTVITSCQLRGGDIRLSGTDRMPAPQFVQPSGGLVEVQGGSSRGDFGLLGSGAGSMALQNGSTAKITVTDHIFDLPPIPGYDPQNPQPAVYVDATIGPNQLEMRNCEFLSGCMPFSVASPQHVEVRPGLCPDVVASAPVTNLISGFNYTVFHVGGTAAIGQITVSNFDKLEYRQYNQRCLVGSITLIAVDGFSLVPGTGFGAVQISQATTIMPGQSVTLVHDPATCTWTVA